MKLIAENCLDEQILPTLVALLKDLRVEVHGFRKEEAIAPIFWSADDFSLELSSIRDLKKDEMSSILKHLEPDLQKAMILAGFQIIKNHLYKARGAVVHQHHRYLQ